MPQTGWRWCNRCEGTFYGPRAGESRCPAGGAHVANGSGAYELPHGEAGVGQAGWSWCTRCQGLWFSADGTAGRCPAGGGHVRAGSGAYGVRSDGSGQSGWRWCNKCQGLWFAGRSTSGRCPAGGGHSTDRSGTYRLNLEGTTARERDLQVVATREVTIREADHDVATGITVQRGDQVRITAAGEVWAGVWFTGSNGPEGWEHWDGTGNDRSPLRGTHPFGLLGRIDGRYFHVGRDHVMTYAGSGDELALRINDDVPGNGSGEFRARVDVLRERGPVVDPVPPAFTTNFTAQATLEVRSPHTPTPAVEQITGRLTFGAGADRRTARLQSASAIETDQAHVTTAPRGDGAWSPDGSMTLPVAIHIAIRTLGGGEGDLIVDLSTEPVSAHGLTAQGRRMPRGTRSAVLAGIGIINGSALNGSAAKLTVNATFDAAP